ncbi:hypothetical protein [Protaetiibacter mangrovi]|uniref:FMN-binding protein n=1 Tax=Protaetiibacter mangrovi TaxID=2970926 RepID=A0ABT1ZDH7_9MICO|nr:hypothetical protein [Protaetiibacter mangrovi]MCS0498747.1 hypothetical protein [Protaetiibacter mangrovi]TPX02865.1 hypothetical protein FJ656_20180 [Schumannella luteola]
MTDTIRTVPAPVRLGAIGAAGLGLLALAGCASGTTGSSAEADTGTDTSASYTDGTYTAEGSYISPAGEQSVAVELTLEGDVVTAVTVTPEADDPQAEGFQEKFAGGIADVVVGKDIDTLDVSRVAGSSLTSGGFNKAIETIKSEALAS